MISGLLLGRSQAQTSINTTNRPTVAEAIRIVSGLQAGMKESDANKYLINRGIMCNTNRTVVVYHQYLINPNFTWTTYYPLRGNCSLDLVYYHADTSNTWTKDTGWERDGTLCGVAEIQSNDVSIISITLTNSR